MKFLYDLRAGELNLEIKGENYKHLKALRYRLGDILELRNLKDLKSYKYEISNLNKTANLTLISSYEVQNLPLNLKFAWAVVDANEIEKALPILNELGVGEIIFVYSDFSQKNIRLNLDRFHRILIASSQQCGRHGVIKFSVLNSSDELKQIYKNIALIDFGGDDLRTNLSNLNNQILFIGPEGGFSDRERNLFENKFAFKTNHILRSTSAIIALGAIFLA